MFSRISTLVYLNIHNGISQTNFSDKTVARRPKIILHTILNCKIRKSSNGLVNKGVGVVIKFRVWIPSVIGDIRTGIQPQNAPVLSQKILQCCQHCRELFQNHNSEKIDTYRFFTWEYSRSKVDEFI